MTTKLAPSYTTNKRVYTLAQIALMSPIERAITLTELWRRQLKNDLIYNGHASVWETIKAKACTTYTERCINKMGPEEKPVLDYWETILRVVMVKPERSDHYVLRGLLNSHHYSTEANRDRDRSYNPPLFVDYYRKTANVRVVGGDLEPVMRVQLDVIY